MYYRVITVKSVECSGIPARTNKFQYVLIAHQLVFWLMVKTVKRHLKKLKIIKNTWGSAISHKITAPVVGGLGSSSMLANEIINSL
jgi:hypothetical protein